MNLLVPAALAFGIIIPVILVFYFLRPKRQERVIGSTLLWQQALQHVQASRPWQRLRVTPLLLLQLLAAVVIVLILARPALLTNSPVSGDTIIILQASASMQATDVAPNRFEKARNQIADFIDTLGSGDHLSLITMAHAPEVLIAQSQDKQQLHAALNRAHVTNQDADLEQALSLATSLASGHSNAQVLVVGDGHVIAPGQSLVLSIPVRYLRIGTDAANTALLALASRNVQGNLIALAQVANYSHQQRTLPVELYANGQLVSVQSITLAPENTGSVQWGPLNTRTQFLHAHIVSPDALSVDDDAWAIVGSSIHGRALLVTNSNAFLLAALRQQPGLDLYATTPARYNPNVGSFDLTIFDGFVPPTLPTGDLFFVNPPNGSYIFGRSGPQLHITRINAGEDAIHALNTVDVSSIHALTASHQLTPALWAQSILTSPETPLLVAGETNNRRIAVLGFDLHDSDLPLQPAFPILMFNLVNWFLPQPVTGDAQAPAGLPVTIQTWPGAQSVTITSPNKQSMAVAPPFPALPYTNTDQTGIYQVSQRVQGQDLQGAFTVNLFNPAQSQLVPAQQLPVAHSTSFTGNPNSVPRELREIWPWIAAFLLLVLCFEWWLFSRSYQSQSATSRSARQTLPIIGASSVSTLISQLWNKKEYKKFRKRFSKAFNRRKLAAVQNKQTPAATIEKRTTSTSGSKKGNRHANV